MHQCQGVTRFYRPLHSHRLHPAPFENVRFEDGKCFVEVKCEPMPASGKAEPVPASASCDKAEACFCRKDSDDDTIQCDGPDCKNKDMWFHLGCVGLTQTDVPEGEWFCLHCRGS